MSTHAIVVDGRIDEAAVRAAVESDAHGAIAIFCGVVRDHDGGRSVRALDYRAHPDAERFLADIVARVHEQTGCLVAAAHRIGDLHVGDVALYAAASAGHRAEAFAACELLVEEIKRGVPIWKRQHYVDGVSEWVGL